MQKLLLEELTKLNFLNSANDRPMSAASGLVKIKNTFYVIADDQLALAVFVLNNPSENRLIPLVEGRLPADDKARKKVKPDWEALVPLQISESHLILLVVPSGSTMHRNLGVVIEIRNGKDLTKKIVDFSELYKLLSLQFIELNIEGAAVSDNFLKLFQRGNGISAQNAVIDLDLNKVMESIEKSENIKSECFLQATNYDLGKIKNVNLSFTDACFCADGNLFFLAVAEGGQSTFNDGEFLGSVLGCINGSGKIDSMIELQSTFKPEGLWVEKNPDGYNFYVVTDADDSKQVSSLYVGRTITK